MKWGVIVFILMLVPVQASMIHEIEQYSDKVRTFIDDDSVIVFGDHMSKTEKLVAAYIKEKYPRVSDLPICKESECTSDMLANKTIIIMGGPNQNSITSKFESMNFTIEKNELSIGFLSFLSNENQKIMIFSDKAGYENTRKHPERSPLARIIPMKFVPTAATAIGVFLLWLWRFLLPIFKKIIRLFFSSKMMRFAKKKKLKKDYKGFKVKGIRLKFREWIAILSAALIFALAISYEYWDSATTIMVLIGINFLVNSLIYAIRHLVRLYMDKVHELHTEYKTWIWGGIITIITGWLGNTFALAGYTVSDRKTKREARIQYTINTVSFMVSIIFLIWNWFAPSIYLQMVMILAMAISVIQMLPMKPFAGKNIYKWNKIKWWITFTPMFLVYMLVHLWV